MYDDGYAEYRVSVDEPFAGLRRGSVDAFVGGGRIGGLTFDVFDSIRVVQTLQYSVGEEHREKGVGLSLFATLAAESKFASYAIRDSGQELLPDGKWLLQAIRSGNKKKGRPPLPYHLNACFRGDDLCKCGIAERRPQTP